MQQTKNISFLKGDKTGSETDYRDALPINMSAIKREIFDAKGYMLQIAGLTEYGGSAGVTGGAVWNAKHEEHYRIQGDEFVSVSKDGVAVNLGEVGLAAGGSPAATPVSQSKRSYDSDFEAAGGCGTFWTCSGATITPAAAPNGYAELAVVGEYIEQTLAGVVNNKTYILNLTWRDGGTTDTDPELQITLAGGATVTVDTFGTITVAIVAGLDSNGLLKIEKTKQGGGGDVRISHADVTDRTPEVAYISEDPSFESAAGVDWVFANATVTNGVVTVNNVAAAGVTQTITTTLIKNRAYQALVIIDNYNGGTLEISLGGGLKKEIFRNTNVVTYRLITLIAGAGQDLVVERPAGDAGTTVLMSHLELLDPNPNGMPRSFRANMDNTVALAYTGTDIWKTVVNAFGMVNPRNSYAVAGNGSAQWKQSCFNLVKDKVYQLKFQWHDEFANPTAELEVTLGGGAVVTISDYGNFITTITCGVDGLGDLVVTQTAGSGAQFLVYYIEVVELLPLDTFLSYDQAFHTDDGDGVWVASASTILNGLLNLGTSPAYVYQVITTPFVTGRSYLVSLACSDIGSGTGAVSVSLGGGTAVTMPLPATGQYSTNVIAGSSNQELRITRASGGATLKIEYLELVDEDLSQTELVSVGTASLPYSFTTQGILTEGKFYLYDTTKGFREVTDGDLGFPIDATWIDGYYFFTDGDYLFHTDLEDEESIDPLKFGSSSLSPDKTKGVARTNDNKVAAFSRYQTEYFTNIGTANFAFTRIKGRMVKAGIVGTHCKCELDGRFFIMGGRKEEDVSIHALSITGIESVASREVDKIIGEYEETELVDVVLESRVEKKYQYLIVHLPNEVLLYNLTIAKVVGHEHAWTVLRSDEYQDSEKWRAKHGIFEPRKGKFVYGDKRDGTIGILDNAVPTQYGEIVGWTLFTPFIYLNNASIDKLEIETISGYNSTDDATVAISMTYNGVTYGKEQWIQYGQPSHYGKGFIVNRLGHVEDWVSIKLRGASESRMAFSRAFIEYE